VRTHAINDTAPTRQLTDVAEGGFAAGEEEGKRGRGEERKKGGEGVLFRIVRPSSDEEGQPPAKRAAGRLTGLAVPVEKRDRPSSDEEGQARARERHGVARCARGGVV